MADVSGISPRPLDVPSAEIGAAPLWDARSNSLLWVDVMAGLVHRYRPSDSTTESFAVPTPVGSIVVADEGGYLLGLEDGFWAASQDFRDLHRLGGFHDPAAGIRMNAGKVDPQGRFWAGTMAYDLRPGAGALGRLDADGGVTVILEGLGEANGLDWSPTGETMYLIDSATQSVAAFDFDAATGGIDARRSIIEVPPSDGLPDGLTVDAEGYLWITLWNGWCVRRYDPAGSLDRVVSLPAAQVTGTVFGGADLADQYVTTAAYQLSPQAAAEQPDAGRVFVLRPGPAGRPAHYAGAS